MAATRDGRPHRWINTEEPGATVFVTTTCLDFVPAFHRDLMRELAALSILRDSRFYEAKLHAFVVMAHHLHLLLTCPPDRTVAWLMQRMKSNLAKLALPQLTADERTLLSIQAGLNQRTFWKPSFRGLEISTSDMFFQKVRYIHLNPVRANLVDEASVYRWSSQRLWDMELWSPEDGLSLSQAIATFDETVEIRVSELQ